MTGNHRAGPSAVETAPTKPTQPFGDAPHAAVEITQYSGGKVLAVWAAGALPMGLLAWIVAPWLAGILGGSEPLAKALLMTLTLGLVWQFVLVLGLVWQEQRTLRWRVVREALWLNVPTSPRAGRRGGRVWFVLIPLLTLFYLERMIPDLPHPPERDLGHFLFESGAGEAFFAGAWHWFGVLVTLAIFNTVLGEELLFRGLLLPRMNGAFGKADWIVNGALFASYHVHTPWVVPAALLDAFILSYPTKRYRSAWIGIAVHSLQSVGLIAVVLPMVL
jgi:membrane protease YdiL (CAAX protease family)